jgi:hypothetical protein
VTWYRLDCVNISKPDATTPALIWLEDVSAVGPAQQAPTAQVPDEPSPVWKVETIRLVSLRNGQVFIVRGDEAAELEAVLIESARPPGVREYR